MDNKYVVLVVIIISFKITLKKISLNIFLYFKIIRSLAIMIAELPFEKMI